MPAPTDRIPTCHPDKPHYAKGLCATCYKNEWKRNHPVTHHRAAHTARHRTKVRLLCEVLGIKPRGQSLGRLLGDEVTLRQLHLAHKRGEATMAAAWPMLSTEQKAAVNYGKVS